jgi:hypothetical protein
MALTRMEDLCNIDCAMHIPQEFFWHHHYLVLLAAMEKKKRGGV